MTRIGRNIVATQHNMRMKFRRNPAQLVRRRGVLRTEVKMMVLEQLRYKFVVCMALLDENNSKRVLHLVLPILPASGLALVVFREPSEAKW
jgi:hypothetical protein